MEKECIWFNKIVKLSDFEFLLPDTLGENLGIQFTELGPDYLKATMPVDRRTKQPHGMLHGGASVALAETIGSVASWLVVNPDYFNCMGLEINANHLRPVKEGIVTGICSPIHLGGKTHVWDIRIYHEKKKLCCISRLTVAIVPKNKI